MAILVVDDSRAMRMIVSRELRKAGYENIVEADNGAAALRRIRAGGIDLVLSDWNMPDMNGIDLLVALRASADKVTFGFVTSESAPDTHSRALGAGAAFVLTKPFNSEDLDKAICSALGDAGAPAGRTGAREERTVASVLTGLLGREVTTAESTPPERSKARALAEYAVHEGEREALAHMDMSLAASLACALARIPPVEAAQWARAHAFSDLVQANLFEVSNVLGAFAAPGGKRCVLRAVSHLSEGELPSKLRDRAQWHAALMVDVDGYMRGRLAFGMV